MADERRVDRAVRKLQQVSHEQKWNASEGLLLLQQLLRCGFATSLAKAELHLGAVGSYGLDEYFNNVVADGMVCSLNHTLKAVRN